MLGSTHPDVATSLNTLGFHHLLQVNPVQAEPLLERALTIREAALGKNLPNAVGALLELASVYMMRGRFARAESLFERTLALQEAALGKSHPLLAETLQRFAINTRSPRDPKTGDALTLARTASGGTFSEARGS